MTGTSESHRLVAMADEFLHLEDTNETTLTWVTQRSEAALARLGGPDYTRVHEEMHAILSAKDKLEVGTKRGEWVYNFHTDDDNPRGLWRRASFDSFLTETPEWNILLDLDELGKAEGQSWVFGGAKILYPDYRRALVSLSPGGSDADVVREFDLETLTFIDDGFVAPESKGSISYTDSTGNATFVARDFGEDTLTLSGYPRTVRRWERGTDLADAPVIFEGRPEDIMAFASHDFTPGYERDFVFSMTDFRSMVVYEYAGGELRELLVPHTADSIPLKDWVVLRLRYDWDLEGTTFAAGSLLILPYADALAGPDPDRVTALYTPTDTSSLLDVIDVKSGLVFQVLDHVASKLYYAGEKNNWEVTELESDHGLDTISVTAVDANESDDVWVINSGFTTPPTLSYGSVSASGFDLRELRSAPTRFNADGLATEQRFATSADGTKIPYFVVGTPEALSGNAPARCLLDGYGGFEISRLPSYVATYGKAFLERGGVYALANIRGGGEYGPSWHQVALKAGRHLAYEDYAAVAADLVERGVTTKDRLAAMGGSNGGLLIGNMYTTFPDHFGALICQVPLLDMKRFNKLLAGASWMDEYGNPDTDDWEFLQKYSAYHNVKANDDHPPIFVYTSTKDDRVHPGHARKFTALLESLGKDVTYYENTEGGHAGAADAGQKATMLALMFSFLDEKLSR